MLLSYILAPVKNILYDLYDTYANRATKPGWRAAKCKCAHVIVTQASYFQAGIFFSSLTNWSWVGNISRWQSDVVVQGRGPARVERRRLQRTRLLRAYLARVMVTRSKVDIAATLPSPNSGPVVVSRATTM